MDQIYPDQGLTELLNRMLGGAATDLHWHLFTALANPFSLDSIWADIAQPGNTGYAPIAVAPGSFAFGVSAHLGSAVAPAIVFTCSAGSSAVLGYAITNTADNILVGIAEFDSSQTFDSTHPISVVPIIGDFSGLSS